MHRMTSIDEEYHYTQVAKLLCHFTLSVVQFANAYFKFINRNYLDLLTPHVPSFSLS